MGEFPDNDSVLAQDTIPEPAAPGGGIAAVGATANKVTVGAAHGSLGIALIVIWAADQRAVFLLLPLWLLVHMGLNAVDGMLACEFAEKSRLGAYLNKHSGRMAGIFTVSLAERVPA